MRRKGRTASIRRRGHGLTRGRASALAVTSHSERATVCLPLTRSQSVGVRFGARPRAARHATSFQRYARGAVYERGRGSRNVSKARQYALSNFLATTVARRHCSRQRRRVRHSPGTRYLFVTSPRRHADVRQPGNRRRPLGISADAPWPTVCLRRQSTLPMKSAGCTSRCRRLCAAADKRLTYAARSRASCNYARWLIDNKLSSFPGCARRTGTALAWYSRESVRGRSAARPAGGDCEDTHGSREAKRCIVRGRVGEWPIHEWRAHTVLTRALEKWNDYG